MSGLKNLNKRLVYHGGKAEDRFIEDKLKTLKKALLYSYQAEIIKLSDGKEFRCLINKDKLSEDYYDKIISIPYKSFCLNTNQNEIVGLKPGDIFTWIGRVQDDVKIPDTKWLIYLQYLEENAYFRADIRQCNSEVEINGNSYPAYIKGPAETDIIWNQKQNTVWNDLNYSLIMYISKTKEIEDYFHRFSKIKIDGNTWQVAVVNPYYANGIIKVCLNEYFNNEFEDIQKEEEQPPIIEEGVPYIDGPFDVSPYDIKTYNIINLSGGDWFISNNKKAKILEKTELFVKIEIITGKSGEFDLIYKKDTDEIKVPINIKSL